MMVVFGSGDGVVLVFFVIVNGREKDHIAQERIVIILSTLSISSRSGKQIPN